MRVKIRAQVDSKGTMKVIGAEVAQASQAELNRVISEMRQQFPHFVVTNWIFDNDLPQTEPKFRVNWNGQQREFDNILWAAAFQKGQRQAGYGSDLWAETEAGDVLVRSMYKNHETGEWDVETPLTRFSIVEQQPSRYYFLLRPPFIGTHPAGEIARESWQPMQPIPGSVGDDYERRVHGWVDYPEPLEPAQVWKYDLLPADSDELEAYEDWRDNR